VLRLFDEDGSAWSTADLPRSFPNLGVFEVRSWQLRFGPVFCFGYVEGKLTEVVTLSRRRLGDG
jgi:hypothetical protein